MCIVIGDVHAEYNLLMKLFDILPHDNVCFTGDLIDRGPDSFKVVDFVKKNNYHCVLGNHEFMARKSKDHEGNICSYNYDLWMYNGGRKTLKSYFGKLDSLYEHVEWMKKLPILHWINDKTVVSHSYYLPYIGQYKDSNFTENVLWERNAKHNAKDILNVHGHTIVSEVVLNNCYVNVDTGAYSRGKLSAYNVETGEIYQVYKEGK